MRADEYAAFTDTLVRSLEADHRVLGLVALGSMAAIDYQPDEWSDHDFFVITMPGDQESLRNDLSWLPDPSSISFSFRETAHGLKVLYRSGHLLEFAVFEPEELALARVNRYRVLIDRADIASRMSARASETSLESSDTPSESFLWGQFLTNVLVGVGRYARGERLSGGEFIRSHAIRHLLLLRRRTLQTVALLDNLDPRRRVESADPEFGSELARCSDLPALDCARGLLGLAAAGLPDPPREALEIVALAIDRIESRPAAATS